MGGGTGERRGLAGDGEIVVVGEGRAVFGGVWQSSFHLQTPFSWPGLSSPPEHPAGPTGQGDVRGLWGVGC